MTGNRRSGRLHAFLAVAVALGGQVASAEPPRRTLLVVTKAAHKLAIVDLATLKVVSRLDIGPDPHEVVADGDGGHAYVTNMEGTRGRRLDVLDLVAAKALPPIDLGPLSGPHGIDFAGGHVWFTAQGAKAVAQIGPDDRRVAWVMGTGQDMTHLLKVRADGKRFYATNVGSNTVSIFDYVLVRPSAAQHGFVPAGRLPSMEWSQAIIAVGPGSEGFDVTPDGRELWTASPVTGDICVVGTETHAVRCFPGNVKGANRLKFSIDAKLAFVSNIRTGELAIFDVQRRREIKRLRLGKATTGIAIDPDGSRLFVAVAGDDGADHLVVIDRARLVETARIDVGQQPDGMNFAIRR